MDLNKYRMSEREIKRSTDLISLVPKSGVIALDIGARDGYFSRLLAERYSKVVALDLEIPMIDHPRIECVTGNLINLQFADKTFDLVFCAEVLEHIHPNQLQKACNELIRVTKDYLLIGVPFEQDLRLHRTTCSICGTTNPPWGHVNSFDETRLKELFNHLDLVKTTFVGETKERTNAISAWLMEFAGNPFGTYDQEEPCINCGNKLTPPSSRNLMQRLATRVAHVLTQSQQKLTKPRPIWIHLLFRRRR